MHIFDTQSILTEVLIAIAVALLGWRRNAIVSLLKRSANPEWYLALIGGLAAAVGAFLLGWFKVSDASSWNNVEHSRRSLVALCFVFLATVITIFAGWAANKVKELNEDRIRDLDGQLAAQSSNVQKLEEALNNRQRLAAQISGLLELKTRRVKELLKGGTPAGDLTVRHERETQVHAILEAIHEFFYFELRQSHPSGKMRLGLFLPVDGNCRLTLFYGWNGTQAANVFSQSSPQYMHLNSPLGIQAEVVKTYHRRGDRQLSIIPDCEQAARERAFSFFFPGQEEHLKSMLAFKYMFQSDGTEAAMVLALDCDRAGFFSLNRHEEISDFLTEMLLRFEYEMLKLDLVIVSQAPKPSLTNPPVPALLAPAPNLNV